MLLFSSAQGVRYWVGGSGDWDDPAHWSYASGGEGGASVPSTNHNVYFDANSDIGTDFTVYVRDLTIEALTLDISGVDKKVTFNSYIPEIDYYNETIIFVGQNIIFPAPSFIDFTNLRYLFTLSFGTRNIDTKGKKLTNTYITVQSGTAVLTSDLFCRGLNIAASSTLNTNNYRLDVVDYLATTGVLILQNSTVYVGFDENGNKVGCSWCYIDKQGAGSHTIHIVTPATKLDPDPLNLRLRSMDANNWNNLHFYPGPDTGYSGIRIFAKAFINRESFGNLSITTNNLYLYGPDTPGFFIWDLSYGSSLIVNNTLYINNTAPNRRIGFFGPDSTSGGFYFNAVSNFDYVDIMFDGNDVTGFPTPKRTGQRLREFGGAYTSGLEIPSYAPRTIYLSAGNLKYFTNYDNVWSNVSGGTPDPQYFPMLEDTVIIDDNSCVDNAGLGLIFFQCDTLDSTNLTKKNISIFNLSARDNFFANIPDFYSVTIKNIYTSKFTTTSELNVTIDPRTAVWTMNLNVANPINFTDEQYVYYGNREINLVLQGDLTLVTPLNLYGDFAPTSQVIISNYKFENTVPSIDNTNFNFILSAGGVYKFRGELNGPNIICTGGTVEHVICNQFGNVSNLNIYGTLDKLKFTNTPGLGQSGETILYSYFQGNYKEDGAVIKELECSEELSASTKLSIQNDCIINKLNINASNFSIDGTYATNSSFINKRPIITKNDAGTLTNTGVMNIRSITGRGNWVLPYSSNKGNNYGITFYEPPPRITNSNLVVNGNTVTLSGDYLMNTTAAKLRQNNNVLELTNFSSGISPTFQAPSLSDIFSSGFKFGTVNIEIIGDYIPGD